MERFEQVRSKPANKLKANRSMRLIVLGMMGGMPVAGVVWQVLHYLEGFRRLGLDVFYIEDTGAWPYNPEEKTFTADCTYTLNFVSRIMAAFGFSDRWAYRSVTQGGRSFGLPDSQVRRLFEQADILVNLTASTVLRDEHLRVPIRIYLETDPVLPQIEIAKGNASYIDQLGAHTHHFSYGENVGAPDCGVPIKRFRYCSTRQPVIMDWWAPDPSTENFFSSLSSGCFTTIASWRQTGKDVEWNGETYTWSKHHEFLKFIDLPRHTAQPMELALWLKSDTGKGDKAWAAWLNPEEAEAIQLLTDHGWRTVSGVSISKDIMPYRDYILTSRGEFTVAKDQNVRLRSGWFSDRSACYLAAGHPVITQDTGFGKFVPTGEGLFSFRTMEDILAALEAINSDYHKHSRAARAIAEEYFRAETVLTKIVDDSGL